MKKISASFAALLLTLTLLPAASGESRLLTDNHQPGWGANIFKDVPKIATGAEILWVTTGEFACDAYLVETGSRPEGKSRMLLDGRIGPEGDCQAFGKWDQSTWATFTVDLKKTFLIDTVALWTQQRENSVGSGEVAILLSEDNVNFTPAATAVVDPELQSKDNLGVKTELKLEKPLPARYVQYRIRKKPQVHQQVISEVAVFGNEIGQEQP